MPAAKNKQDLVTVSEKEYAKLKDLISNLSEGQARVYVESVEASVASIISHRTEWIRMFFTWYEKGVAGKDPEIPAPGYKWNQLKAYNATIWERDKDVAWATLYKNFLKEGDRLINFIKTADEKELYTPGVYAWTGKWTLGRYAEASAASHFRSAAKYVRQILKELA
jgi:hypothetical protein